MGKVSPPEIFVGGLVESELLPIGQNCCAEILKAVQESAILKSTPFDTLVLCCLLKIAMLRAPCRVPNMFSVSRAADQHIAGAQIGRKQIRDGA